MEIDENVKEMSEEEKQGAIYEAILFLKKDLKLSYSELSAILKVAKKTIKEWFVMKRVPLNQYVTDLIAIHRSLFSLFSKRKNRLAWLRTLHPFLKNTPLGVMAELDGLSFMRGYLEDPPYS